MSEEKKLVTIERIQSVCPIFKNNEPTRLVSVRVLGYDVIVTPESFGCVEEPQKMVGMLGFFFEIDSYLPDNLASMECFKYLKEKRVKTIRLCGSLSQGMFLNLNTFGDQKDLDIPSDLKEGDNVTNILGVTKYYSSSDPESTKKFRHKNKVSVENPCLLPFPDFLPKTDEDRLQKNLFYISLIKNQPMVCTLKLDGQSATFFYNTRADETGMCSRNYLFKLDDEKQLQKFNDHKNFVKIDKRYNILNKLRSCGRNIAIQGELYGPGINKNRMQVNDIDFAVFNIFNCDTQKYMVHSDVCELCTQLDLPQVPELLIDKELNTVDDFVKFASEQTYDSVSEIKGLLAEGVVFKNWLHPASVSENESKRISFKVISPLYLEHHKL
jgi:RNA ligase (TIGR02306 family)